MAAAIRSSTDIALGLSHDQAEFSENLRAVSFELWKVAKLTRHDARVNAVFDAAFHEASRNARRIRRGGDSACSAIVTAF